MLKNLVGEDNARRGVVRWFELLQSEVLNKHLFYVSLEKCCRVYASLYVSGKKMCMYVYGYV